METQAIEFKNLPPGSPLDFNQYGIDNVKIDTKYCVSEDIHDAHVQLSLKRGLQPVAAKLDGTYYEPLALVCSGPSLEDEIEEIKKFPKILTCSGAHDFLIKNGIIPTWHMEADPRRHKVKFVENPHPGVQYLIASSCHPAVFDSLREYDVKIWHCLSGERRRPVLAPFPRGHWHITGGGNVGMRALVLGRMLGYTNIHVFGMDCSARKAFHVGQHPNEPANEKWFTVKVGNHEYQTSQVFLAYAQQFFHEIAKVPDLDITLHGDGFLQALSAQTMSDPAKVAKMVTKQPSTIALMNPETISAAYVELNREMHKREDYGSMGYRWTDVVIDMKRAMKADSVLDYGCGKGALARKLPFPIWEYDPAIADKDEVPRPADLVICTDVLEHVEPEMLDATLRDLARCTIKAAYLVIHTGAASKSLPDGRNTHLIQQGAIWWTAQLEKHFTVVKVITKRLPELIVVVGPKKDQDKATKFTSSPQRRWHILESLIKKHGWTKGVEVGVKEGFTFLHLLQTCPDLEITGIDIFRPRPELEAQGGESHSKSNLPEHEARLRRVVKDLYSKRAKIMRAFSVKAAEKFKNGSLDFVFIDADHREKAVREDIAAWVPKIRKGGMLCGHDAQEKFPGVIAAINDLCPGWQQHPDSVWVKEL